MATAEGSKEGSLITFQRGRIEDIEEEIAELETELAGMKPLSIEFRSTRSKIGRLQKQIEELNEDIDDLLD